MNCYFTIKYLEAILSIQKASSLQYTTQIKLLISILQEKI